MAASKSSLSAGEIIRAILTSDGAVAAITAKVFPVVVDKATLPYIVYRRTQLEAAQVKDGRAADSVGIEVLCYARDYTEGVELAEAVRTALDGVSWTDDEGGLTMRSCFLSDAEEGWSDDAFCQQLIFTCRIH